MHTRIGCQYGASCLFCHGGHPKRKQERPQKFQRAEYRRLVEEMFRMHMARVACVSGGALVSRAPLSSGGHDETPGRGARGCGGRAVAWSAGRSGRRGSDGRPVWRSADQTVGAWGGGAGRAGGPGGRPIDRSAGRSVEQRPMVFGWTPEVPCRGRPARSSLVACRGGCGGAIRQFQIGVVREEHARIWARSELRFDNHSLPRQDLATHA